MGIALLAAGAMMVAASGAYAGDDEVTAEQFLRLVRAQQSAIRDVAFAFEGEQHYLGPKDEDVPKVRRYQGRYALRFDGATFLESYSESGEAGTGVHRVSAVVGRAGEVKTARIEPGSNYFNPIIPMPLGPGSFFRAGSPETFQFVRRFQTLKESTDFAYSFLGWEEVDGHRCAHITFSPHPNRAVRVVQELWVDLERGGHPLRLRNKDGEDTVVQVDHVRLKQITLPSNEQIWFPVGGDFSQYYHAGKYPAEPSFRTTLYVLDGTLFFNQDLKDKVFHVEGEPFRPTFQVTPVAAKSPSKSRRAGVDVVDAEKKLDAALADLTRKAEAKGSAVAANDASASLREEASRAASVPWVAGGLGAGILAVAGVLAFRRRS